MSNISKKNLSTKEVEDLSYYDFMSYLGASFYQIGGPKSTLKLARQCHIDKDSKVLDVGCGTGYNACLIAEEFGCTVVGVDISELSIEKARERAEKQGLTELVEFHVGDAYDLPFEYEGFDVVITEFVSQFLDLKQAFKEFTRVLKKGGYIGINEMYKDDEIPTTPAEEIKMAEDMISDLTKLPFKLNTPRHWKSLFIEAGLRDVEINKSQEYLGVKDLSYIIGEARQED